MGLCGASLSLKVKLEEKTGILYPGLYPELPLQVLTESFNQYHVGLLSLSELKGSSVLWGLDKDLTVSNVTIWFPGFKLLN